MTKFNELYSDFKHGEFSPKLYGRKDLEEYRFGARLIDNFIPRPTGGLDKRGGLEFVADVTDMASITERGPALIPYIISKTESYIIVVDPVKITEAPSNIRIFKNDGTEASIATSTTVETNPAGLDPRQFNYAQIGNVLFLTHASGRFRPMIIARNSTTADNFIVQDYFRGNLGLLLNPNLANISEVLRTPFRDTNVSTIALTPSAASGSITIASSAGFFDVGQIGSLIKIVHGTTTGVARITGFNSSTNVNAEVIVNFGATSASDNWQESSWSIYRGYPRTVAAFEQRLVWGGNIIQPDTLWVSRLGNVFHMMKDRLEQDVASSSDTSGLNYFIPADVPDESKLVTTIGKLVLPDDPFNVTIASQEVNPISWLSSGSRLLIGTLGAEYVAGGTGEGFGIETASVRQQTNYGGAPRKVVRAGNEVFFLMRDGTRLRSFKFNEENGSYISANIAFTAEHLVELGPTSIFSEFNQALEYHEVIHQPSKDIIWATNSRNRLVGVSYSIENGNVSWFRTTLPDVNNVWSTSSIPDVTGGFDDFYVVVERTIAGNKKFYLEKITNDFDAESLNENPLIDRNKPVFLDSSIVIDNTAGNPISTVTGLGHLEGKDVYFIYKGKKQGPYTVDGAGEIELDTPIANGDEGLAIVGLAYSAIFESLDLNAGQNFATSEGQNQRADRVLIRFDRTGEAKLGTPTRVYPIKFNTTTSEELFSGTRKVPAVNSPDEEQIIRVQSDEPVPCTITSMAVRGMTYES